VSSRNSFPIIGTTETCCLLVVTVYVPAFLILSYFDHLHLLGLKFSYKNLQSECVIILIITNLQSSSKLT